MSTTQTPERCKWFHHSDITKRVMAAHMTLSYLINNLDGMDKVEKFKAALHCKKAIDELRDTIKINGSYMYLNDVLISMENRLTEKLRECPCFTPREDADGK